MAYSDFNNNFFNTNGSASTKLQNIIIKNYIIEISETSFIRWEYKFLFALLYWSSAGPHCNN